MDVKTIVPGSLKSLYKELNRRFFSLTAAANPLVNPTANPLANSAANPLANSAANPAANSAANPAANPAANSEAFPSLKPSETGRPPGYQIIRKPKGKPDFAPNLQADLRPNCKPSCVRSAVGHGLVLGRARHNRTYRGAEAQSA